jgi:hypothetical protein
VKAGEGETASMGWDEMDAIPARFIVDERREERSWEEKQQLGLDADEGRLF